jgi:hypothetical protein
MLLNVFYRRSGHLTSQGRFSRIAPGRRSLSTIKRLKCGFVHKKEAYGRNPVNVHAAAARPARTVLASPKAPAQSAAL